VSGHGAAGKQDLDLTVGLDHLAASRARLVAAADEMRRRLQRDLHDGPQQRLEHAVIALKALLHPGTAQLGPWWG
jgi:signal transduction histidine kinase